MKTITFRKNTVLSMMPENSKQWVRREFFAGDRIKVSGIFYPYYDVIGFTFQGNTIWRAKISAFEESEEILKGYFPPSVGDGTYDIEQI